ncbi:phage tail terminator-like protein [Candidatus Fukatsuia endosymbiont of Tuberolachnus salignus]|uniref:phage tail terminator-like protein n=1 Tax=Candidatus Fukatsuia endosymbiont of Tuberolachnus salignus TaxID=3077957 RepID=UPI00313D0C63
MSTGRVIALLEHHLGAWAAQKGFPVASQNVQFSDTGGLYLQSHLLPATTECLDLAQVSRVYHGVYQITLCAPTGSGQAQVQAIADDLISLFDLGTLLTDGIIRCAIISVPTVFTGITHCHTYSLPLSMRYRAYVI